MDNKQFYPAYIPGKWNRYTRHKKKRIRKKYQNRIRQEVRRHKVDAQTLSFLLADADTKYSGGIGYKKPELLRFSQLGGSRRSESTTGLFTLTVPQIAAPPRLAFPQITPPAIGIPAIEVPEISETTQDALEKLGKAFEELKNAVLEAIQPIVDYLVKVVKKFFKWAGDFCDHLWCKNKRWWYMAEHHKKRRIRKKYRNKIMREARRRAGELLEILATDDSEDDSEDDKEGP